MIDFELPTLRGKEFEAIIGRRLNKYRTDGAADIRRAGVQATMVGKGQWQVIPSRPDFEGVLPGPIPVFFDCKVCGGPSMDLAPYRHDTKGARKYQLQFMLDRSRYGVPCAFLVHWNRRELSTKAEEAATYWFPVQAEMEFWKSFEAGEIRRLTRADCEELGHRVPWNLFSEGDRNPQPDVLAVL